MRSVSDHLAALLHTVGPVDPIDVALEDAVDCIVAEDTMAVHAIPRNDIAACDGYAVRLSDLSSAPHILTLVAYDNDDPKPLAENCAMYLTSGMPLPEGADSVVDVSLAEREDDKVIIQSPLRYSDNVILTASDIREGELLLSKGERIDSRRLALAAAAGLGHICVHPKPRIVIIPIGSELIDPGSKPAPRETFDANGVALSIAVQDVGAQAYRVDAVPDDLEALRNALEDQLIRADLIITTGGLNSTGTNQITEVLTALGSAECVDVALSPGSRHASGVITSHGEAGIPVICLPGNPVEAHIGFEVFVRPALRKMAGHVELFRPSFPATVREGWISPAGMREVVRVNIVGSPESGYTLSLQGQNDDRSLSNLARCNALAFVPESVEVVSAGDRLHVMSLVDNR